MSRETAFRAQFAVQFMGGIFRGCTVVGNFPFVRPVDNVCIYKFDKLPGTFNGIIV